MWASTKRQSATSSPSHSRARLLLYRHPIPRRPGEEHERPIECVDPVLGGVTLDGDGTQVLER